MTETQFHTARRMFFVLGSVGSPPGVLIGPRGYAGTHRDWWAGAAGVDPAALDRLTRGYFLDGVVQAYRGPDFSPDVPLRDAEAAAEAFDGQTGLVRAVRLGAVPGEPGAAWPGDYEMVYPAFRALAANYPTGDLPGVLRAWATPACRYRI